MGNGLFFDLMVWNVICCLSKEWWFELAFIRSSHFKPNFVGMGWSCQALSEVLFSFAFSPGQRTLGVTQPQIQGGRWKRLRWGTTECRHKPIHLLLGVCSAFWRYVENHRLTCMFGSLAWWYALIFFCSCLQSVTFASFGLHVVTHPYIKADPGKERGCESHIKYQTWNSNLSYCFCFVSAPLWYDGNVFCDYVFPLRFFEKHRLWFAETSRKSRSF